MKNFILLSFILFFTITLTSVNAKDVSRLKFSMGSQTGLLILVDLYDQDLYSNLVMSFDNLLLSYKLTDTDNAILDDNWTARLVEGDIYHSFKIMISSPGGDEKYMIRKESNFVEMIVLNNNFDNINLSDSLFSYIQNSNLLFITKKSDFVVLSLTVFDVNGAIIYNDNYDKGQYYIDMKNLSAGIYFIETRLYDKVVLKKLNYIR